MAMIKKSETTRAIRPVRPVTEMERWFGDMFNWPFPFLWRREGEDGSAWSPKVELLDHEDKYTVRAELPGVKPEDVDITLTGNILTISGERKLDTTTKEKDYVFTEHMYGSFCRSIELPVEVDSEKIEACYDNGILEVDLPKSAESKPRKVKVQAKATSKA